MACWWGSALSIVPSTLAMMCPVGRVTSRVSPKVRWSLGVPTLRASSGYGWTEAAKTELVTLPAMKAVDARRRPGR